MPEIFQKNKKLNVIEYGEHCQQNLGILCFFKKLNVFSFFKA